ncbi:MAG: DUF502 domain-containing protein [Phycisphaerae bacterium]
MRKHLQIFLAGALVVVPFAVTAYLVWILATWLGGLGYGLVEALGGLALQQHVAEQLVALMGALLVLGGIYMVGILARSYIFRKLLMLIERFIAHLPGVKTIYESVRDLMKLFGADSGRMGKAVLYQIPQTEISLLGIMTNENPLGTNAEGKPKKVAVYLPFSYMFGGLTMLVGPDQVKDAGMSVDQALKICATASVSPQSSLLETPAVPKAKQVAGAQ